MARKFLSPRLGAALIFWLAAGALQKLDWGDGPAIAALLLLAAAATVALGRWRNGLAAAPGEALPRLDLIAAGLLLLFQLVFMLLRIGHPSPLDITVTTFEAGKALLRGLNPYRLPLDPFAAGVPSPPEFSGFKYPPVMAVVYLPLASLFGPAGMVLTNFVCQLGIVAGLYALGRKLRDRRAGLYAVLLYLAIPLVTFQLFAKTATDIAAVLPLPFALLLWDRRAFAAGLLVGLSISTKPTPGLLLIPSCLPAGRSERGAYLAGIAVGLLPTLAFFAWDPAAIWNNIVLFNFHRAVDTTSWLATMPAAIMTLARAATLLALAASFIVTWRRPPPLRQRLALGILLILLALLSGPGVHHNYQLWWLPLFAPLLMAAPWPVVPSRQKSAS